MTTKTPTTYDTGPSGKVWVHGALLRFYAPGELPHHYCGPCPDCGSPTFDYGGGWRCLALVCARNDGNPAPDVGPAPTWWNTGLQVKRDGSMWCATLPDFVNLQVSPAGFGSTPQAAVDALYDAEKREREARDRAGALLAGLEDILPAVPDGLWFEFDRGGQRRLYRKGGDPDESMAVGDLDDGLAAALEWLSANGGALLDTLRSAAAGHAAKKDQKNS